MLGMNKKVNSGIIMIENVPYLHQMRNDRVKKFMLDAFLAIRKRSKLQTGRYNTLYTSNLKISSVHALLHDHNRSRQRLIYRSYQGECRETSNCTSSDAYASRYIESSAILMVFVLQLKYWCTLPSLVKHIRLMVGVLIEHSYAEMALWTVTNNHQTFTGLLVEVANLRCFRAIPSDIFALTSRLLNHSQ